MENIINRVEDLTILQSQYIMTATDYNILPDGTILLHIPSPDGYAKWHNDAKDFLPNAESLLSKFSVNHLTEWKPSQFTNSKAK